MHKIWYDDAWEDYLYWQCILRSPADFDAYKMSSRNVQKILNKNVQFNSSRIILDNVLQAV